MYADYYAAVAELVNGVYEMLRRMLRYKILSLFLRYERHSQSKNSYYLFQVFTHFHHRSSYFKNLSQIMELHKPKSIPT